MENLPCKRKRSLLMEKGNEEKEEEDRNRKNKNEQTGIHLIVNAPVLCQNLFPLQYVFPLPPGLERVQTVILCTKSILTCNPMKMALEGRSVRPGTVSPKHNIQHFSQHCVVPLRAMSHIQQK